MSKNKARRARWDAAAQEARKAYDVLMIAVADLRDLQSEYEEWKDNLPESLSSSPTAEKLETVCDIDLSAIEDFEDVLSEIESIELPSGFGRD